MTHGRVQTTKGDVMPTIHFNQTTTLSSEEFVAGALKTVGRGVLDTRRSSAASRRSRPNTTACRPEEHGPDAIP
jgi:hypothetical protein